MQKLSDAAPYDAYTYNIFNSSTDYPTILLINPTSIAKPHALQQLQFEILSQNVDVVAVSESWLKSHHLDQQFNISGFSLFRKDRVKRKGGGVCLFVSHVYSGVQYLNLSEVNYFDPAFEILWVKLNLNDNSVYIIGVVYHPPKPIYPTPNLINYLDCAISYLSNTYPNSCITLCGDFNQLPETVFTCLGFINIVNEPTHKGHRLDRIYLSNPVYSGSKVYKSTINTEHSAVITFINACDKNCTSSRAIPTANLGTKMTVRSRTPGRHANFLGDLQSYDWSNVLSTEVCQSACDNFYNNCEALLNKHYPLKTITLGANEPYFVTPNMKILLRKKNYLMHQGRLEEANALAVRIGKQIAHTNSRNLHAIASGDPKAFWTKINETLGKVKKSPNPSFSAEALNQHYSSVSQDSQYIAPVPKLTCQNECLPLGFLDERSIFMALDKLGCTATGPDNLPAWFLKIAAPCIAKPVSHLFNISYKTAVVPNQWKSACITPIAKTKTPSSCTDYRPISITPVLSRIFEKILVNNLIYPAFCDPSIAPSLTNQFAFRPTGSTTAALISLLHRVTNLLENNQYVHIISLDFSKAFDTVRHSSLFLKLAKVRTVPDELFNFLISYYSNRNHSTRCGDTVSTSQNFNAGIVQGSALGPPAFVITAADLTAITPGNSLDKYADDTYLVVPGCNTGTIPLELTQISQWATSNNLKLNTSKTKELIISKPRFKCDIPPLLPGIERVTSLNVLGITITGNLDMSDHIDFTISKCCQTFFGLKVLKSHGLHKSHLDSIFRSLVLSRITYGSPAWRGFATLTNLDKITSLLRKGRKWGLTEQVYDLEALLDDADKSLFGSILGNPKHVLSNLLPPNRQVSYSLRPRPHNYLLPVKTTLKSKNFFVRMLYKNVY